MYLHMLEKHIEREGGDTVMTMGSIVGSQLGIAKAMCCS